MTNLSKAMPYAKIGVNKLMLKEHKIKNEAIIHLKDDSNFEILLKNPTDKIVGVSIKINDEYISNRYLILYPGQHFWLDSNPETHKKFFFKTYYVKNNKGNRKAIEKNGVVEIMFHDKIDTFYNGTFYLNSTMNINNTSNSSPHMYDATIVSDENVGMGVVNTNKELFVNNTPASNAVNKSSQEYNTTDIKTGRIVEQGDSNQQFKNMDIDFHLYPFSTFKYHLMPESSKVTYMTTDLKVYCSNCGRRKKKSENYCPKCGHKF